MEQFVLGIFQEQLSKFIIGFRKEQVTANLLNGKGEITNVEINCSFLNSHISKLTPFVELERVHISKLSFSVTSWTNLRKAPIIIDVEHVEAYILEPLHYLDPSLRKTILQVFASQLPDLIRQGLVAKRGAYNLFDRILDNLTIEVRSILVEFTTWGKFKTRRIGPWTPPKLQAKLAGVRMVSVNEYGHEASPDDVWRHNHNRHSFLIYKKIEIPDFQLNLLPQQQQSTTTTGDAATIPISLLSGMDNKMEIQLAIQRRVKDGETLAVQMDATLPKMEIDLTADVLPHVYSVAQGLLSLLAKDRAFVDPLRQPTSAAFETGEAATEAASQQVEIVLNRTESSASDNASSSTPMMETDVPIEEDLSSSSSDEETSTTSSRHKSQTPTPASSRPQTPSLLVAPGARDKKDRPVIVLPLGLCIHERISFSLAIHHATIRGTYAAIDNTQEAAGATAGYIQTVSKGFIAEMIWPKVDDSKGGYLQASVGFVRVTERFGSRVRTLLVGGAEHNRNGSSRPTVARDESFPLYEERSIRPDPCGLRYTFPIQCFGLKTTVEFLEKPPNNSSQSNEEDIKVIHEVGIDQFDLVMDCQSWARVIRFGVNESGGGFDPRLSSGDWSSAMTQDMLLFPGMPLDLETCLQPTKELLLDENDFLSSDLFNVTARVKDTALRMPAAILDDIRSCDINLKLGEVTFVVSSALPRTFLSGKIGSSVHGDDAVHRGAIDFPNDPSDIPYILESSEDPSNRQRGLQTLRPVSTFRVQLTLRATSLNLAPIITCCVVRDSEQLLSLDELTMIVCFEGEPPNVLNENVTKVALFVSAESHRLGIALDLDLLSSAVGTTSYHTRLLNDAFERSQRVFKSASDAVSNKLDVVSAVSEPSDKFSSRKVLVRHQLHKSRETGGVSLAFCFRIMELDISLWRQNVKYSSAFRLGREIFGSNPPSDRGLQHVPLLKLLSIELMEAEFGLEASLLRNDRRIVVKGVVSETTFGTSDFSQVFAQKRHEPSDSGVEEGAQLGQVDYDSDMARIEILKVGRKAPVDRLIGKHSDGITIRAEDLSESNRNWALAIDMAHAVVDCHIDAIEALAVLLFEALLMPAWSKPALLPVQFDTGRWQFPLGSIGAFLQGLLSTFAVDDDEMLFSDIPGADSEDIQRTVPATIDAMLRDIIWKLVPVDVEVILLRYTGENLTFKIPTNSSHLPPFGLVIEKSELVASYLATAGLEDISLLKVTGAKGFTWRTIICTVDHGLRHKMHCRQRIISCASDLSSGELDALLVEPFEVAYTYAKSEVAMSVRNPVQVKQVERLDDFLKCLRIFGNRLGELTKSIETIVSVCRNAAEPVKNMSSSFPVVSEANESPTSIACRAVLDSVRSAREATHAVNECFSACLHDLRRQLLERDLELARMRCLVFEKERERLAALAVTASAATGWLRIGSAQQSGQRGIMSWNLLPCYCVLQKSLLLTFSSPGSFTPIDVIPVSGSSLRQLGGGRKRDLKRAFALVEKSGSVHVIVTSTDREFYHWVGELSKIIGAMDTEMIAMQQLEESLKVDGDDASNVPSLHSDDNYDGTDERPRQNRFAKAIQQAKSTGQVVAERRRRRLLENERQNLPATQDACDAVFEQQAGNSLKDLNTNNGEVYPPKNQPGLVPVRFSVGQSSEQSEGTRAGQHLRNRLAGMKLATKSRVETALVAAKQKSKEVSVNVHTRKRTETSSISETKGVDAASIPMLDPSSQVVWTCAACTFDNKEFSLTCEICLKEREPQPNAPADDYDTGYQQLNGGIDDQSDGDGISELDEIEFAQTRLGVRDRIGAAVSSLRRNGQGISVGDDASGRFAQRRSVNSSIPGAPDAFKLRDVGLAGPLPPARYADPLRGCENPVDLGLKRLDGNWIVNAQLLPTSSENRSSKLDCLETQEADMSTDGIGSSFDSQDILLLTVGITVFNRKDLGNSSPEPSSIRIKQVHELLALHSEISDALSACLVICSKADDQRDGASSDDDAVTSSLALVRIAGQLFSGLLHNTSTREAKVLSLHCLDLVSQFLNALLEAFLPFKCLSSLIDFLGITNASTTEYMPPSLRKASVVFEVASMAHSPGPLISVAEACFVQAETQAIRAEQVATLEANENFGSRRPEEPQGNFYEFYHPISHQFRDAMYSSLVHLMEERDEAHARMVTADVVHVHEIEQEKKIAQALRRQISHKDRELETLKLAAKKGSTTSSYAVENAVAPSRTDSQTDTELISLCNQLSAEISSRTAASLEILRLKESRSIERENEAAERDALEKELARTRELLAQQEVKLVQSQQECSNWKQSYEKILKR